jgi:hypothetical protein
MEKLNYKPSIVTELFTICGNNPELTMGQIFHSFLRPKFLNEKHLTEATDEEIYIALEKASRMDLVTDSILTEEQFNDWVNKK